MTHRRKHNVRLQSGFSLLESLLVVVILLIVLGIATSGLVQMTRRSAADQGRMDTNQMARQFMDQVTTDLHQVGYPSAYMYDPGYSKANPDEVAVGFIALTANTAEFEADVDGSGTVSHVYLQLLGSDGLPIAGGTGQCPCTFQRGVLAKKDVGGTKPPYYTEVNNVLNTDIFSADDHSGTSVGFPITDFTNIRVVRLKLNLQTTVQEVDGSYPTITMQSAAKIMNLKLN